VYIVSLWPTPDASDWFAVVQENRLVKGSANAREARCMNDCRYGWRVFTVAALLFMLFIVDPYPFMLEFSVPFVGPDSGTSI